MLVMDDKTDPEILINQKFREKIRTNHRAFVFASNGRHALEKFFKHRDADVVPGVINMPELSGFNHDSCLNEKNGLLKSFMVLAFGEKENLHTAMNSDAFHFIAGPVHSGDPEPAIEKATQPVNHIGINHLRSN
jgi:DNA-binding NtrC family response regulator